MGPCAPELGSALSPHFTEKKAELLGSQKVTHAISCNSTVSSRKGAERQGQLGEGSPIGEGAGKRQDGSL